MDGIEFERQLMKTNFFQATKLSTYFEADRLCLWDIGARDGFDSFFAPMAWAVDAIGFEPASAGFEALSGSGTWKSERYLPVAVGGRDGEAVLNIPSDPAGASFLEHDRAIRRRYHLDALFDVVQREAVPVRTIGAAIREFDACAPTLLKLDIEGSELAVLEGAGDALSGVLAVKAEAAFLPLRKDQPLATDILTFMEDAGFCLMDMIDSHLWRVRPWAVDPFLVRETPAYSRGRLVQTDLLFLRDIANLDEQRAFSAMLAAAGLGYFDHAIEILNAFPSIISERSGADIPQMSEVLADTAKSYGRVRLGMEICQAVRHFARLVRSRVIGLGVPPHR